MVLSKGRQVAFRVNAFRMRNMVDVPPPQVTMQSNLQLLVAKLITYTTPQRQRYQQRSRTPDADPKVKAVGKADKCSKGQVKTGSLPQGQQGSPANSNKPCRNWGIEEGCKSEATCRFINA